MFLLWFRQLPIVFSMDYIPSKSDNTLKPLRLQEQVGYIILDFSRSLDAQIMQQSALAILAIA